MDLNHLYSQHQISLIGAASTSSCSDYARHVADAEVLARQIHDFRVSKGALAPVSWVRGWFPRNDALVACTPAGRN